MSQTVVIARWENQFDYDKMKLFIKFDADKSDDCPAEKPNLETVTNNEIEGQ